MLAAKRAAAIAEARIGVEGLIVDETAPFWVWCVAHEIGGGERQVLPHSFASECAANGICVVAGTIERCFVVLRHLTGCGWSGERISLLILAPESRGMNDDAVSEQVAEVLGRSCEITVIGGWKLCWKGVVEGRWERGRFGLFHCPSLDGKLEHCVRALRPNVWDIAGEDVSKEEAMRLKSLARRAAGIMAQFDLRPASQNGCVAVGRTSEWVGHALLDVAPTEGEEAIVVCVDRLSDPKLGRSVDGTGQVLERVLDSVVEKEKEEVFFWDGGLLQTLMLLPERECIHHLLQTSQTLRKAPIPTTTIQQEYEALETYTKTPPKSTSEATTKGQNDAIAQTLLTVFRALLNFKTDEEWERRIEEAEGWSRGEASVEKESALSALQWIRSPPPEPSKQSQQVEEDDVLPLPSKFLSGLWSSAADTDPSTKKSQQRLPMGASLFGSIVEAAASGVSFQGYESLSEDSSALIRGFASLVAPSARGLSSQDRRVENLVIVLVGGLGPGDLSSLLHHIKNASSFQSLYVIASGYTTPKQSLAHFMGL